MREWLRIAREPAVVGRAVRIALVVGTMLILINHGDALMHGALIAEGQADVVVALPLYVRPFWALCRWYSTGRGRRP